MDLATHLVTRRRFGACATAALGAPALLRPARAEPLARPLPAPDTPTHYRFRLGDFAVTMLLDAATLIDGPWPIVGEEQPREAVETLMRAHRLPPSRFQPGFTPVLVDTGRSRILIDAGNGAVGFVPRPGGGRLVERLRAAGYQPEDIDLVAVTHCHTDHIGGLMDEGRPIFPNAAYAVAAAEFDFWRRFEGLSATESYAARSAAVFRSHLLPLADRMRFLKPGDDLVAGITALGCPGHTPGHLAYHVESGGRRLLAWGDCAHHEVASLAHPEWHVLFDMDKSEGARTRAWIYDMAAHEDLAVAGYHTSFPSLGYVARQDQGFRWIPLSYQFAP